jgi:hypothetical protein
MENVEIGKQGTRFGDFRRCKACRQGYWVQALNRTTYVECPICGVQQTRISRLLGVK